jgi:drug/metabolite transporter (DMT)-like permease
VWLGLGIVYVVWGSTYLAIRVMVRTIPPLLGAGLRFALAGAIVLLVVAWRREPGAWRPTRREALAALCIGTLLAAGGNGLVTIAERDVPSALAALLIASVPLWVVVYRSISRDRVHGATLGGVVVGFVGVALLLLPGNLPEGVPLGGAVLCIVAAASWAAGTFASPRAPLPSDPLASTGWQMLLGGLVMVAIGVVAGEVGDVDASAVSGESLVAFAYLLVFGSLVAFTAYVWLLQNAPVSQVATYAYVNPVVAILLGATLLDETLTTGTLVGAAIIVASVAVIVRREARPQAGSEPRAA